MLNADLDNDQIIAELEKTDQIQYIASLYQVPCWRVKQKIKQGISLSEMELCFDIGAEM